MRYVIALLDIVVMTTWIQLTPSGVYKTTLSISQDRIFILKVQVVPSMRPFMCQQCEISLLREACDILVSDYSREYFFFALELFE